MASYQGAGGGVYDARDLEAKKRAAAMLASASIDPGIAVPIPNQKASIDPGIWTDIPGMGGGGAVGDNTDYLAIAKQMYEPQFDYLDQQQKSAEQRAGANKKSLGNLFEGVAHEILGMQGGIKKNYGSGIAGTKGAYDDAYNQIGGAFDKSRNDQMEILKRLGITQAAGNVVGQNADARALLQGITAANNQGSTNALRQMQQSALTFNTEQGNITRQAGADAQAGVGKQLEDFLMQLSGQRANLDSEMNKQAWGMKSSAADRAAQSQSEQAKLAWDQAKYNNDFNYKVAHDKADMDLKLKQLAMKDDSTAQDPLGKVNALAMSLYGGNPQAASNATKAINDALMSGGGEMNSADDLIRLVIQRNKQANGQVGDAAELARLAALAWSEMYGKQAPSSLGY